MTQTQTTRRPTPGQLLRLIDDNFEYLSALNDGDLTQGSGACLYEKSLVQVINDIVQ